MSNEIESRDFPLVPTRNQLSTMQLATRSLVNGGQADNALEAGDLKPEFTHQAADGKS